MTTPKVHLEYRKGQIVCLTMNIWADMNRPVYVAKATGAEYPLGSYDPNGIITPNWTWPQMIRPYPYLVLAEVKADSLSDNCLVNVNPLPPVHATHSSTVWQGNQNTPQGFLWDRQDNTTFFIPKVHLAMHEAHPGRKPLIPPGIGQKLTTPAEKYACPMYGTFPPHLHLKQGQDRLCNKSLLGHSPTSKPARHLPLIGTLYCGVSHEGYTPDATSVLACGVVTGYVGNTSTDDNAPPLAVIDPVDPNTANPDFRGTYRIARSSPDVPKLNARYWDLRTGEANESPSSVKASCICTTPLEAWENYRRFMQKVFSNVLENIHTADSEIEKRI